MERSLQLRKGQRLRIEGIEYRVTGGIEFYNRSDSSRWNEYCLQETRGNETRWLSVDNLYEEYAIYRQCPYSSEFDEINIQNSGYHDADSGTASVTGCFGIPDTEPGDTVRYTEYEDGTEELIMAVEQWEDETEYSRGYYLDFDEIEVLDGGETEESGGYLPARAAGEGDGGGLSGLINGKNVAKVLFVLVIAGIFLYPYIKSSQKSIQKYLKGSGLYSYETSITSDLNSREKADVYSTTLSVDEAVKDIIRAIDGKTEDVQKSEEDDSVCILTKKEYCLVYTSTEQRTMVQISSRAYVYQSTNTPYRASPHTHSYYRGFYYSRGFWNDRDRYSRSASGYENYSGDTVETNLNDPYKNYSNSIRQSSVNSRNSSGGGISSGK